MAIVRLTSWSVVLIDHSLSMSSMFVAQNCTNLASALSQFSTFNAPTSDRSSNSDLSNAYCELATNVWRIVTYAQAVNELPFHFYILFFEYEVV